MKRNYTGLRTMFSLGLLVFMSCRSTRPTEIDLSNNKKLMPELAGKCEQTVRYYIEKLREINSGQEVNANTQIVINPSAKLISLTSEPPGQDKVNFDTNIESVECNLSGDLTEGQSTYRGYIKQTDGTTTSTIFKLEAKSEGLTITGNSPGQSAVLVMLVSRWEVIGE